MENFETLINHLRGYQTETDWFEFKYVPIWA